MLRNSRGYALLDVMLALVVIGVFAAAGNMLLHKNMQIVEAEQQKESVMQDLYGAQLTALSEKKLVRVRFYRSGRYTVTSGTETLLDKQADPGRSFAPGSLFGMEVYFTPSGTVRQFGTVHLTASDVRYRLVFLIGRGRFYAEK
ncbi:hypothetical protein C6I21_01815 [Alkalicoccus urumqiensis]|uniref:Competence protein ComG n=2 Tax=Alkalicoccus urumqiensis TaxID=1548213 RepID=A0A2P6MK75_ALKUR|nr:hypothetical protein C6I21_01815 [Alkalicoccus urumqiensis]